MSEENHTDGLGARLLYAAFWLLSRLPLRVLYALGDAVCVVVHRVVRYRLRVVRQNLASAFPEKTPRELRRIEAGFYHYFCDQFVETVKSLSMTREEMMRRMQFEGLDAARRALGDDRKFLFIMLGHYGNWEWIASLQYWLPEMHCTQIYHRLRQSAWDSLLLRIRSRYGGECVPMKKTLRRLLELRRGPRPCVVGFIADQLPKWDSIHHFTPFLRHDTAVYTGAEHISKRIGSAMVYGRVTRLRRGHYRCELLPMSARPEDEADFRLTDLYFRTLEADIRRQPEIWLWSHKRWSRTKEEWLRRQSQRRQAQDGGEA